MPVCLLVQNNQVNQMTIIVIQIYIINVIP